MTDAPAPVDALPDRIEGYRNLRVTVMGLGLFGGGAGTARFFAEHGADVLVTDRKNEEELRPSIESLAGLALRYRLNGHVRTDFVETDLVVASPAVPPDAEPLRWARQAGVPVESELSLFFRHAPSPWIVGITGSNGKTTTTRLCGEIFRCCDRRVHVGGNVGGSILARIDSIGPTDVVVLEISSFQAEDLDRIGRSPRCAVVLNLTPNHLDRHGSMEAYARAKRALVAHQTSEDWAVLGHDDPRVRAFSDSTEARVVPFGLDPSLDRGLFVRDGRVIAALGDGPPRDIFGVDRIRLLGDFNRSNVLAAVAPALLFGCAPEGIEKAVSEFRGVEHRLEPVGETESLLFLNDSIATTPESTIAALRAVPGPRWLIVGGYDKGLETEDLVTELAERAAGVALIGRTGAALEGRLLEATSSRPIPVAYCETLDRALDWILERADAGSVVLSPGFASYDQFANFVERGERFRARVRRAVEARGDGSRS